MDKYGILPDLTILQNIIENIWNAKSKGETKYKYESSFELRPTAINKLKRFGYIINKFNKKGKIIYEIRW